MTRRLQLIALAALVGLTAGTVASVVHAQAASRLFASLSSQLTTGQSTPVTCTANGSGCFLDVQIAGGGGTFTASILEADGTVAAPSYSFTNATGSGLYSLSAGRPALSVNGTQGLFLDGTGALVVSSALKFDAASTDIVIGRNGAAGRLAAYGGSASVGVELAIGSVQPTLTSCGTGTLTAKSTNIAGEVTATGATACTINFGAPVFSNQPFCVIEEETSAVAQRISAISTTAFTVTGLTSGDKFMYQCLGGK